MDEKRFRRRGDARADRPPEAADRPSETANRPAAVPTQTVERPVGVPIQTVDPPPERTNGHRETGEAEPQPRPRRSRRMPVLRATPTAMPGNPPPSTPNGGAPASGPDTTDPVLEKPHATGPASAEKAVPEQPTSPRETNGTPMDTAPLPTEGVTKEPESPAMESPEDSGAPEGRLDSADKSDGSGSAPVTIPSQRRGEKEGSASDPKTEDLPATPAEHVDDRPPAQYVDRPAQRYVDERPPAQYVDDRPPAEYVDRPAPRYVDDRPGREREEDASKPKPEGKKAGPAWKVSGLTVSWKSVGVLLLAVAVVFWLGRGLVGGPTAPDSGPAEEKQQKRVKVPEEKKPKTKALRIDGNAIRAAGPVITLNPALAQPGANMTVSGAGFDGGSTVDVMLSPKGQQTGTSLGWFKTDKSGALNAQVVVPDGVRASSVIVTAKQQNSDNIATAEAVTAAGMGFAKLSKTTGKPGDTVSVSARGFAPSEQIKVYWGRASGVPTSTLQADESGGVGKAPIRVGVGQVGEATLVLVGAKSGTTATVPFYMLGLYPTVETAPYALKAGDALGLSASGFAPDERVLMYVNTSSGPPAMTARADTQGNLGGLGFKVPFGLRGSQSIVMVGEKSRASVSSGFQVLPYTPSAQTSTYGGSPGTSFSFFAKGFAPNEAVYVYLGRTKWDQGQLVSAFRVNEQGEAGAAGKFQITGQDQGTLNFTLVGRKSQGKASTSLKVTPATGPVDIPQRQEYKVPAHLRK